MLYHWELSHSSAIAQIGSASATPGRIEVVPTAPNQFTRIAVGEHTGSGWDVLAVNPQPKHAMAVEEIYIREQDLIARFRQSETDTYGFQLDWHLLPPSGRFIAAIELWLSVQTSLLDSQPELEVVSRAADRRTWDSYQHCDLLPDDVQAASGGGPAALVCQTDSATGLWLIEPSDQCHACLLSSGQDSTGRVRLFGHFMEKGVIRRARMRFLVADGPIRRADIVAAYRDLADSPLPLTA